MELPVDVSYLFHRLSSYYLRIVHLAFLVPKVDEQVDRIVFRFLKIHLQHFYQGG